MMLKLPFIIAFILSITLSFVVNSTELLGDKAKKNITPAISKSVSKKTNKKIEPSFKTPALLGGRTKSDLKAPASLRNKAKSSFKSPSPLGAGVKSGFKTPAQFGNKASSSDGRSGIDNKAQKGFGRQGSTIGGAAVGGWQSNQSTAEEDTKPGTSSGPVAGGQSPFTGKTITRSGGFYSGAKESFSSEGAPTFTLGNGQQVPRADGDGGMGMPDDKGGVLYPDGTYINTNADGGTNVFNADGTRDKANSRQGKANGPVAGGQSLFTGKVTTRSGGFYSVAKETLSSDGSPTFTLGNGQQVPRVDGAGGMGMPDDKGGVMYPDGTYINTNGNGGTNVFNADGTRDKVNSRPGKVSGSVAGVQGPLKGASAARSGGFYSGAKESFSDDGAPTFTLGNGQQVPRADGAGGIGMPDDKGGVLYPDGTYINTNRDGGTNVFNPDGTLDKAHSVPGTGSGPVAGMQGTFAGASAPRSGSFYSAVKETYSGNGTPTFTLSNGQQVPRADGAGGMGMPDDKGGVLYPDGTYINTNGDGGTNVFNPDGTRDEESSRPGTSGPSTSGSSRSSNNDNSKNNEDSSNDGNNNSKDNDDDSKENDDSKDNDDDSSGGSEDTSDSSDESTESETDTEGAEESQTGLGTGSYGGYTSEGKQAVDTAASVGNSTTEDVVLGDCGDGKGGQVMDQQQQDNCTPGGLVVGGGDDDEDDSSGKAPIWQAPSTSTQGLVTQPGIDDDSQFNDEELSTMENLGNQIDSVTNPGGR
jgi:hypothetical protein